MIKKNSYERRVYESIDDISLSKAISQKNNEKNKSCNKGLIMENIVYPITAVQFSFFKGTYPSKIVKFCHFWFYSAI